MYRVVIYAPDRHLIYDGGLPERRGVGGGHSARIRLARALASMRHEIRVIANVSQRHRHCGVLYIPLDQADRIDCDVLIINSSKGEPDLLPLLNHQVSASLRVVWVQGIPEPRGIHDLEIDYVCAPSNFIRKWARDQWGVSAGKIGIVYNAVDEDLYQSAPRWRAQRNPYRLVYAANPHKGLEAAIEVFRLLRNEDERFELHVFGGEGLWGNWEADKAAHSSEPGLYHHGVIGQKRLARELWKSSFSLNLQAILEACSIVTLETMAAGCIVLASPVGAYPEVISSGHNGFLIAGNHMEADTWQRAAQLILTLVRVPDLADLARQNARSIPWTWKRIARVWTQQWDWFLERKGVVAAASLGMPGACFECGASWLAMADGYHCMECGNYSADGTTPLA